MAEPKTNSYKVCIRRGRHAARTMSGCLGLALRRGSRLGAAASVQRGACSTKSADFYPQSCVWVWEGATAGFAWWLGFGPACSGARLCSRRQQHATQRPPWAEPVVR